MHALSGLVAQTIPSPPFSGFSIGPLQIKMYALCILTGIFLGFLIARRRWIERGGNPETLELALAVGIPFGIIGARLYYVVNENQRYFCDTCNPLEALYIWKGGLGIMGAVAVGTLAAWFAVRKRGVKFLALADAAAPGFLVAQAVGRLGNWFNQELYGAPTNLPWALEVRDVNGALIGLFHPTFLYEAMWNLGAAVLLIGLDRRFRLGHGKVFALYLLLYSIGRTWVESIRIDDFPVVGGLRVNHYYAFAMMVVAIVWLVWLVRNRPGREEVVDESAVSEVAPARGASEPDPPEEPNEVEEADDDNDDADQAVAEPDTPAKSSTS